MMLFLDFILNNKNILLNINKYYLTNNKLLIILKNE
jgi:hypothetical protein